MAEFTARDVQALRASMGVGMMDAKRALTENDGDYERARQWLREQGIVQAGKRAERANTQGAVAAARTADGAALVELKCETDFVAKSREFTGLANEIAEAVAAKGEQAAAEREADVDDLKVKLKENIALGRVVRFEARPGAVLDTYLHVQNERGVNGVVVELEGGDQALAHEVAMHIAFTRPRYLSSDYDPAEEVEAERAVLEAQTRNEGKPEQAIPKIVEGKLGGFFSRDVLLEQKYVKDNKHTIAQLLGDARVTRFAQVEIKA